MLNKRIPKTKLNNLKLLVLDSDGVCLPRGTSILEKSAKDSYQAKIRTSRISDEMAEMISQLKKKLKICISSGRGLIYLQSMFGKILGEGTIIQAENGNLSLVGGKIIQHFDYNEKYFKKIATIRDEIKNLPIKGFEPKQFILTVHANREIPEVYQIVERSDPQNELKAMWNGEAFDIQKKTISKGEGLKKLLKRLKIKREHTIAIGDRINDRELIDTAGVGVSADSDSLNAEYWTRGKKLGGETLVRYLLKNI